MRPLFAVLLVVFCAAYGQAVAEQAPEAAVGERHVEGKGGFSFAPPKDWEFRDFPGMKYQIAFGPAADGFAPNINVVEENSQGTLDAYVEASEATLAKIFQKYKKISLAEFKLDGGAAAMKLVTTNEQQGKTLRQTFYLIDANDKKFVVTCTALAEGGEKLDAAFDASIKTFKLEKVQAPAEVKPAEAAGGRHVEEKGGFSFTPPKGWECRDYPGMKYQIAFGPPADGFAPNINVVDEKFDGTLKAYVEANEVTLAKVFQSYKKISLTELKTEAGVSGTKLVTTNEQNGKALRQTFVFFDGPPGKKLVVTCTTLAEGGEKFDAAFDTCLKSFKVEKPKE